MLNFLSCHVSYLKPIIKMKNGKKMVWSGLSGLVPAFISLMYVADFFTVERVGMVYIRDIPREILKKKKRETVRKQRI